MADQKVNFEINITGNAGEELKKLTGTTQKLTIETGKAKTGFTNLGGTVVVFNQLLGILSKVDSQVQAFTEAYNAQIEAETKLAKVMRNTMGAAQAQVDSIKALASAQQKLGVIGDEVQLAGAQELATYLSKTESLKTLIPVMNDMLAQQYGLNASQEQAAQIASMLGKVMDGQVGALSRYGYKFDEAQEKILKYGTEEQRVATLAEVVSSAVGGMNETLAQTDAGRAKQLANSWGDVNEQLGELSTKLKAALVPTMSKLVDVASRLVGWAVKHSQGIMNTIKVVASLAAGWLAYKLVVLSVVAASKIHTAAMVAKTAVMKLLNGGIKAATISFKAMDAAMKANVIGAVVGVVVAAASAFATLVNRTKEANKALEEAKKAASEYYGQEKMQLDLLFEKLRQTNPKSKERNELVKQLKDMYPDLNKQILDEITNTNNLSAAYDILIGKIQQRARSKGLEKIQEKHYEDWSEVEFELGNGFQGHDRDYLEKELNNAVESFEAGSNEISQSEWDVLEHLGFINKNGALKGNAWWWMSNSQDYPDSDLKKYIDSRRKVEQANSQLAQMQLDGTAAPSGTGIESPNGTHGTAAGTVRQGVEAATTGGTRNTTVNITIGQMKGVETLNVDSLEQGVADLEQRLAEAMSRVLGMAEMSVS
jgi:hypothetical protein